MYSWIASWFNDEEQSSDQVERIMQDGQGNPDQWTWIEVLPEEQTNGFVYVQTTEQQAHAETTQKAVTKGKKRSFSPDMHEKAKKRARLHNRHSYNMCKVSPTVDQPLFNTRFSDPCMALTRPGSTFRASSLRFRKPVKLEIPANPTHVKLTLPQGAESISEMLSRTFVKADSPYSDMNLSLSELEDLSETVMILMGKDRMTRSNVVCGDFNGEMHNEVDEDDQTLLLDLISGKRRRPLSITWYPSQHEVSTQTVEGGHDDCETPQRSIVKELDHVKLTDHVTLSDHVTLKDHMTQTYHSTEPSCTWASSSWSPLSSIEWPERPSIEWQPRLSIGWKSENDSDIVFQPSSLIDLCTEMVPMSVFRPLPKWLRRIDPSCVEFGPDCVYYIPYWMRQIDLSCVEYEDERLPHWLRKIDPTCVHDSSWCALSAEESFASTCYDSEWNYEVGCPKWLTNMDLFEASTPLTYKNVLPPHIGACDISEPNSRKGSLTSIPSWIWRQEDDDVYDGLPRSRRSSLHSVASCASDSASITIEASSISDIKTQDQSSDLNEQRQECEVDALPSWMSRLDVFNFESRQEKVMKHRFPFLDPEITLAAQEYDIEAQFPPRTEALWAEPEDTPSLDTQYPWHTEPLWAEPGETPSLPISTCQSWDYFEDADYVDEPAGDDMILPNNEPKRDWQLVPYVGGQIVPFDPQSALNSFGSYCHNSMVDVAFMMAAVTTAVTSAVSSAASSRRTSLACDDLPVAPVAPVDEFITRKRPVVLSRADKVIERCVLGKKKSVTKKNKKWLTRANLNRAAVCGKGKKSRFFSAQKYSGKNGERAC